MRAIRLHGIGDLRFETDVAASPLLAGEVRIRVLAAGVCGSDLHNFRTGQWLGAVPMVPGHEFAGEILQLGPGVAGFEPGQLVVGDSRVNCGNCPRCLEGRPNVCERMGYVGEVCDGAFAEHLQLPTSRVLPVPSGVAPRVAALAEPLGVALHVLRRLDAPPHAPVLIAGAGPVGGLAAILLRHMGFGSVGVIERNDARAQLLSELAGVQRVTAEAAALRDFAGPEGLRYAVDAIGNAGMLNFLVQNMAGGGRLAMVGLFHGHAELKVNAIVERELDLRGCSVFCEEQREILPLLLELHATLQRVIAPSISLRGLPAEYTRLIAGQSPFLKSVVEPAILD